MNLEAINWQMYGVALAGLVFIYNMFRNARNDINEKFSSISKRFDKIDQQFDKIDARFDTVNRHLVDIRNDITEVKERLSFLEAANIYTMPFEPSEPNPRSQAAREMWKRRKAKRVEKKD
jgi:DNA anti-recombination protein RmuC